MADGLPTQEFPDSCYTSEPPGDMLGIQATLYRSGLSGSLSSLD